MFFRFLVFLFSLSLFMGCDNSQNSLNDFDGEYTGISIRTFERYKEGSLISVVKDSVNTSLTISNEQFERTGSETNLMCTGSLQLDEQISFESGECSCFCDCSPIIDCGGDLMLGHYDFEWDDNNLILIYDAPENHYLSVDSIDHSNKYIIEHQLIKIE